MKPQRATSALLGVAMATTGVYLIVYLFRWQWNRALICGVLFVACEVLLLGRIILQRLRRLDERLSSLGEERVRARIVAARPEPKDRFEWLEESVTRTNVFLPVLLGAGVLASAAAWVVENVARRTAGPALERSLAGSLGTLAFPAGGFLGEVPAPVRTGMSPRWRRAAFVVAAAAVAGGMAAGIDVLADATQTRQDQLVNDTTTVIDLEFRGARATADPTRHASDLVAVCTSQSFLREIPAMAVLDLGNAGARVLLAADLGDHGTDRMRGCLEDTTLEQIQASVVNVSELPPAP